MKYDDDNDRWTGISVLLIENTRVQLYCIYFPSVLIACSVKVSVYREEAIAVRRALVSACHFTVLRRVCKRLRKATANCMTSVLLFVRSKSAATGHIVVKSYTGEFFCSLFTRYDMKK